MLLKGHNAVSVRVPQSWFKRDKSRNFGVIVLKKWNKIDKISSYDTKTAILKLR